MVYRPQYTDKKTGKLKHTKTWYYKFTFAGRVIRESAKTTSKTVAKEAEKRRRRELEEGYNGISDARDERIRTIRELADEFLRSYRVRKPKSASFAEHVFVHVNRLLGDLMAVAVTDKAIVQYQFDRLMEKAAPKTINDEVGFVLRLLSVKQSGAIRAELKRQKSLRLKVTNRVGKAYSPEEKADLVKSAKNAPRSKGIFFALMLAQHAGLRDKEIRTLQWSNLDLTTRIITVGDSKTDAGRGRTIPMNEDLFAAAIDYVKWYTGRFKSANPKWYVFPFGRPRPMDPTRPQTSLKTAWRNARARANVEGRFHDNRHSFVTDLAESGASDQMIQDLAGHVSSEMVQRYSHMRTEAKRKAVAALSSTSVAALERPRKWGENEGTAQNSEGSVQDSVQVTLPN
jgi:integrase